jgi:hypothetical protein
MCRKRLAVLTVALCAFAVALMAACAPRSAPPSDDVLVAESTPIVAIDWNPETDCSACHHTEHAAFSDGASLAAKHATQECDVCHTDASALEAAHEGATTASTLPSDLAATTVSNETCLTSGCHAASDWEELAELTSSSTILADINGTSVNPHTMPFSDAKHFEANMSCKDCHDVHASDPNYEVAKDYCYTCHHHKVFACGTCHIVSG